jgi:hypothetical protein
MQLSNPPQIEMGPYVWPYFSYPMFIGVATALLIATIGVLIR